jgi:glycosyltransferase involved in cell wall biosynthesis
MRIAVVTTSYPKSDQDPGGHFVRHSARSLAEAGHEVHVIAPGGTLLDAPRRDGPLAVHPAGGGSLFGWPGAIARARQAPWRVVAAGSFAAGVLLRLQAIGRIDHAVAHWIVPCAWPLLHALHALQAPLDVFAHGADVRLLLAAPRAAREAVFRSLLDRGARFTFAARSSLRDLSACLSPPLSVRLAGASCVKPPPLGELPNVRARSAALRASLNLHDSERLAMVACRLIASKRVAIAIDAAHAITPRLRVVIAGDGPEQSALRSRARSLGAKVTFVGRLPREEVLAWMGASDVLLHPSAAEAAPTVIREARALGVPVVACDAGDVSDWAGRDSGIRIAAPCGRDFAAAVASLL